MALFYCNEDKKIQIENCENVVDTARIDTQVHHQSVMTFVLLKPSCNTDNCIFFLCF